MRPSLTQPSRTTSSRRGGSAASPPLRTSSETSRARKWQRRRHAGLTPTPTPSWSVVNITTDRCEKGSNHPLPPKPAVAYPAPPTHAVVFSTYTHRHLHLQPQVKARHGSASSASDGHAMQEHAVQEPMQHQPVQETPSDDDGALPENVPHAQDADEACGEPLAAAWTPSPPSSFEFFFHKKI